MMDMSIKDMKFLLFLSSLLFLQTKSHAALSDTINTTHIIRDGETLVSSGGGFELGFFSPGKSKNRYVGIWYKEMGARTVVWVANRGFPLTNTSGILKVIEPGVLVITGGLDNTTIWSSNTSRSVQNPVAQLLDTGNLVVRDADDDDPKNFLWQSFDHPTDTFLPGMKLGWNFITGKEVYISAWKSSDDPAVGEYHYHLDPSGYPQVTVKRGSTEVYGSGPWNGIRFSGLPVMSQNPIFTYSVIINENEVSYREELNSKSVPTRIVLNRNGVAERWTWVDRTQDFSVYRAVPADRCDAYNICGAYGVCKLSNVLYCECLDKFVPKDPAGWTRANWSDGCVRKKPLNCQNGDTFLKYSGLKPPDTRHSWFNKSMTLDECKMVCLKNCSCTAYSNLDVSKGGSGCLLWFEDLINIRSLLEEGQDIYIRMASSENDKNSDSKGKTRATVIMSLASLIGVILLVLSLILFIRRRKKNDIGRGGEFNEGDNKDLDLPVFDVSGIYKATNHFSDASKLGEGGFGPVYKGVLEHGQEIAVKRLSETSMQGLDEFKNEVLVVAKLQHRNLVKLLGCCISEKEKMLIYEYMPNKSLDMVLFDQPKKMFLDWPTRVRIINGIARGLMYLHLDSRLRIIHRDLKASNVLLDTDLNPKISDFGMARYFGGNETGAKTSRVVGTYGYMSPEYAMHGLFSIKSDVFSFGVLVLEIVSGKRNRGFSNEDHRLSLLGHAWLLYKEGRSMELVEPYLADSSDPSEVQQSIHVGLLCVQQRMEDRPTMASVVSMLSNDVALPQPNQPGFFMEADQFEAEVSPSAKSRNSANELSITVIEAR